MILLVMGVAGSGKSMVAAEIARLAGWRLVEGDDLHPDSNRQKMMAGTPLADEDRWPWLDRIGAELAEAAAADQAVVITCSALKRSYRDRLRGNCPDMRFLMLHGSEALLQSRISSRTDHFMPSTLLPSQLATLELPGAGEADVTMMDIGPPVAQIALDFLGRKT